MALSAKHHMLFAFV
ncbi:hypothetical protein CGLO_12357 [Colletotrichum gloeosporioides Cg-14]|uniref:Uncharacterized protein n=1 Tax=Colletotrichum gloeosporioides (strain Cg-14) TaxID=1237896 RepID=T0K615_COLGC|nr:hypothetical protein CGLO_12357 [Colletotrichum gloeosporioides Cg-14]